MGIRVIYLGPLSEIAGEPESELFFSSGECDWAGLIDALGSQVNEAIAHAAQDEKVKLAINGHLVTDKDVIVVRHGDEVALLPPVSGG